MSGAKFMGMLLKKLISIYKFISEKNIIKPCHDDYSELSELYLTSEYLTQNVFTFKKLKFGIEIEFNSDKSDTEILKYFQEKGYISNAAIIKSTDRTGRDYLGWRFCEENSTNQYLSENYKQDSIKECKKELISPVFIDEPKTWIQIKEVLTSIKNDLHGEVNDVCAIHIHIDKKCYLKKPSYFNKLHKLYVFLEPLILCIAAGNDKSVSPARLFHYAAVETQEKLFWCRAYSIDSLRKLIDSAEHFTKEIDNYIINFLSSRYHSINYSTKTTNYSTVEFRIFNGTLDENIIQIYLILIDHILANLEADIEETTAYYDKDGEYYLHTAYIKKCFSLLNFNNYERSAIIGILLRNDYKISKDAIRALEGRYTKQEIHKIL